MLSRLDASLGGSAAVWASIDAVFDAMSQKEGQVGGRSCLLRGVAPLVNVRNLPVSQVALLVSHARLTPRLTERFRQRVGDYESFWVNFQVY